MPEKKLMPFKVVKTPKIRDNRGEYVKRGDLAMLTKETAEHYHKLGYVQVSMEGVFDEPEKTDAGGTEPDSPSGSADASEASADAETDAGADQAQESAGTSVKPRRRRASS